MTRREKVLKLLRLKDMSCSEMCNEILAENMFSNERDYNLTKKNLTSSLSGTLHQMVKREEIEVSDKKGPKGGKIYKLLIK